MKIACPRCGADIEYDIQSGKLHCEYCGSYSDVSEVELNQYDKAKQKAKPQSGASYGATIDQDDIYDEFHCSSCGAQLITDKNTTITHCVYCGSQQMIKQRLTGNFEPHKVLPFKITKENFLYIYRNFVHKKIFAPNEFRNNPYITETKGLYVPYYIYNYDIISYGRGEAQRRSDKNTYYKWFEYQSKAKSMIMIDGSSRLDDSIMSSLEPFDLNQTVDFNPVYLTGFQAERTDETAESLDNKAENRAIMYTNRVVRTAPSPYTMSGGYIASDLKKTCDPEQSMLPIWFVNTFYKNKKYSYAVNGQTGKVVGEVPLSKAKFYPLMAFLCAVAIVLTLFYCAIFMSSSSYSRDDDDDNPGGGIAIIWIVCVGVPYFGIKSRYKNVTHVLSNPIKTWDYELIKDFTYKKHEYQNKYPKDDLRKITFQKFYDGKYQYDMDINRMMSDSRSSLNKNFTVNKQDL
ncbi:MAG: TFIIB-type zinc ribbon-containing protein [Clostridia bacterium]|nr:TFIIB-type zinc ribbon-containing protein [Clostridia bacterium]